jgi:hypothetical protein
VTIQSYLKPHRYDSTRIKAVLVIFISLFTAVKAQDLPKKIRGYTVYRTDVKVFGPLETQDNSTDNRASVKLGEPEVVDFGLYGATFEIGAEISSFQRSGKVDFLMFRGFRVHGIPVEIDEYQHPFSFKKKSPVVMPKPIRVSFSVKDLPKAAYKEIFAAEDELPITGTVFVFGKFKKMGFEFKRVIPIKVDLKIKNPLHS